MLATETTHLEWLQQKLDHYESKLAAAEVEVERLRPAVISLRGTLEALSAERKGPAPPVRLFDRSSDVGIDKPDVNGDLAGKPFTTGNKNPLMPPRRPEYAEARLIDAARSVIIQSQTTIHADQVTEAVFLISSKEQFKLAKHSMASELLRGANKGFWQKLGGNRFRRF